MFPLFMLELVVVVVAVWGSALIILSQVHSLLQHLCLHSDGPELLVDVLQPLLRDVHGNVEGRLLVLHPFWLDHLPLLLRQGPLRLCPDLPGIDERDLLFSALWPQISGVLLLHLKLQLLSHVRNRLIDPNLVVLGGV